MKVLRKNDSLVNTDFAMLLKKPPMPPPPLIPVFISTPDWQTIAPASAFTLSPGASASVNIVKLGLYSMCSSITRPSLFTLESSLLNIRPHSFSGLLMLRTRTSRIMNAKALALGIVGILLMGINLAVISPLSWRSPKRPFQATVWTMNLGG
ncbi:MAG: hypothetical protein Ct9H90mP16_00390 [Candidatus Poseidoniales archaeon]|nr:MAG: hypothetical protein Ct9H90mP16_00390 [Candidatus Poseidoniales archaeon]